MIKIAHLYYDLMNLYGDNGNIKALKNQLDKHEIKYKIDFLTLGDNIDFSKYDFLYMGPGTRYNQKLVLKDILKYKKEIKQAIDSNKFFLVTGNSFDLFGKYILENNKKIKALNVFDFYSINEEFRLTDEVVAKADGIESVILGFQNQDSTMHNLEHPWLQIIKGIGSYPDAKTEGLQYNNFYGTYLIGPILARNPELLKYITKRLILNTKPDFKFRPFRLNLSQKAHEAYIKNYYAELQK